MEARRNVMVGGFVLVGIVALGVLVILFGRGPTWLMRGNTYSINIRFRTAEGVRSGTLVTVYGKSVGRVQDVQFLDPQRFGDGVNVVVAIDQQFQLTQGTRAETTAPGFGTGRPPISLVPGPLDGPQLAEGATIPGNLTSAMESIFPPKIVNTLESAATQIGGAADAMTPALRDMHELLQRRAPTDVDRIGGPQGNMSSALARLDSSLKHFNEVLGDSDTQSNLKTGIENFKLTSDDARKLAADLRDASADAKEVMSQLKATVAKGQDSLRNFDDNLNRVSRATIDGLDKASRFLDYLNDIGATISRGEGTLGKLAKDDRLYEAAVLSFGRLGEMVQEMIVLVKDWQKGTIRVAF